MTVSVTGFCFARNHDEQAALENIGFLGYFCSLASSSSAFEANDERKRSHRRSTGNTTNNSSSSSSSSTHTHTQFDLMAGEWPLLWLEDERTA